MRILGIMRKLLLLIALYISIQSFAQDTITKHDLKSAAKVIDINFTQKEIDTLYEGVKENLDNFKLQHKLSLNNSVPMSLWQSPVLPGMKFASKQEPINWVIPANVQLPANKSDLAFYSILQLASLIKNKKISSVELTKFFIERLKKFGDSLQCVITITEDTALLQAKQADAALAKGIYKSPLQGIPYGLKDLFAVKGYKTTWGAAPYKNQVVDEDAFVYTQLKNAGAVLVAKLTLGALAQGDRWFGANEKPLEFALWFFGFISRFCICNSSWFSVICYWYRNLGQHCFAIIYLWCYWLATNFWQRK